MFLTTLISSCLLALPQDPVPSGIAGERVQTRLPFQVLGNGLRHRHESIATSAHSCVLLGIRTGMDQDPLGETGLARTLEYALRLARGDEAGPSGLVVTSMGSALIASITVPNREVPAVLRFYAGVLSGELALGDDLLARAIAQARLRADDESAEIPGLVHYWRARRVLLKGDPRGRQSCGVSAEMADLPLATVRDRFRSVFVAKNAFVVTMGGLKSASINKLMLEILGPLPSKDFAAPKTVIAVAESEIDLVIENVRADAVFQTAAIRAPSYGEADFIPFLLAMHLAKIGVARERWRFRGGEAQAFFMPFVFSMFEDPGVVLINRRGQNRGDPGRPRQEIESVLGRLREAVPMVEDIKRAVLFVSRGLQLPPYDSETVQFLASQPRLLRQRTFVVALYEVWKWPTDLAPSIYKVKLRRIGEVLKERLASDQIRWIRTLPSSEVAPGKK